MRGKKEARKMQTSKASSNDPSSGQDEKKFLGRVRAFLDEKIFTVYKKRFRSFGDLLPWRKK